MQGWIGHIVDSRAMNIAASPTSTAQIRQQSTPVGGFPPTLFYNSNALQTVLPGVGVSWVRTHHIYTRVISVEKVHHLGFYSAE